jgi:flagellar protein FlbD
MITLSKLNGENFTLNALYIEQVQSFPDTTITLTNGKKLVVKDTEKQVGEKVAAFYKRIALLPVNITAEEEE